MRLTGIVNTAPWQLLSDAELIAALPVSVNVVVVDAATTWDRPDVFVKVTPVEALRRE